MNANRIKAISRTSIRKAYSLIKPRREGRKVILCFHSVHPTMKHGTIRPEAFEQIIKWLATETDLMDVETLLDVQRPNHARPAVALTFDDGHRDNLTYALPIARNYGATFTTYVTAGLLEKDPRVRTRFAMLLRQKEEEFEALSWADAAAMIEQGYGIGSHTWDHPMLSHLPDEGIEFQLRESKELIMQRLGFSRIGMCYPYGKYGRSVDQRVIRATHRAGYAYGLCVEHRGVDKEDDRFAIPRFIINRFDPDLLRSQVEGMEDYHGTISRHMPRFLAKWLSPTDFHEPANTLPPLTSFPIRQQNHD